MPTKADLARELIRQHPEAPTKTLARRLYEENKLLFKDLESARDSVRYARGNRGEVLRAKLKKSGKTDTTRKNGKAGWKPELPPSTAEPWLPHHLPQPSTILVLSDAHIPYHDEQALQTAVEYAAKEFKPTTVLLNGDWCDFYSISRWEKDPKRRDLVAEMAAVKDSLAWLRSKVDGECVLKAGNHEERWDKYIWNKAPELWGLSEVQLDSILGLEKLEITLVKDQRPVMAGKLPIFHGHELPRGLASPVNPARGAFLRTTSSVLVGHSHRASSHPQYTWDKREIVCWSTGCLCHLYPEYARVNSWNLGFAVVEVAKEGKYNVHNFQIGTDGEVRYA